MVLAIHRIYCMDSQDLPKPLPLFSTIIGVAEVVVKLILRSEPLHLLILHGKVLYLTLFNKSRPVFFCQIFVLMEGSVLVPPNLHKLTLVAHPSMRDDLHSYFLPLLLQLFQILNVCLNSVFKSSFSFSVKSSNPCRVNNTLLSGS
jgi:hypothetical protein